MKLKDIFINYSYVSTKFKKEQREIIVNHAICSGLLCWSITQAFLSKKIDCDGFNRIIIQDSTNGFNYVEKNSWRVDVDNKNLIIEIEFDIFNKFLNYYKINDELNLNDYFIQLVNYAICILPDCFLDVKNAMISGVDFLKQSNYKLRYLIKKKSIKAPLKLNMYLAYHLTIFECFTLLYIHDFNDKLLCVSPVLYKSPPFYNIFSKHFIDFSVVSENENIKIYLLGSTNKVIMELLYVNNAIEVINSIGDRYTLPSNQ